MHILALIPARGGSKGIPRKNIKPFCGKPLLAWTIEEARKSKHITRIIVSTDDEEIASVAREYGADVPFMRPSEYAEDSTPDLPVFEHALSWLKEHEGYVPDIVLHLRPNSPLRLASDMDRGIELMLKNPHADSIRAVTRSPIHPLKTYTLLPDHTLLPFVPEEVFGIAQPYDRPRQELPNAYITGGYLSVIRSSTILEKHSIRGDVMLGFEVDSANVADIDTPVQFIVTETLMKNRQSGTGL